MDDADVKQCRCRMTQNHKSLPKIVIIGAGGCGRDVLDIFEACNLVSPMYDVMGFIVEEQYGQTGEIINGKPVLGGFGWLQRNKDDVSVICAVGAPHHRRRLITKAEALGCNFCSVIHPSVIKTRWLSMGTGVAISAGCILTNQIVIEDHVYLNLDCTVAHDAKVEKFSTIAPGVHISGNVTVKEGSYIGTGANIIEKITIGAWSVVGAGSTIIENVPPNTTVVGVPGKVIKERDAGWHLLV